MRFLSLALVLISCAPPLAPSDPKPTELILPAEHASDLPLQMYVRANGEWETTIDYAIGDGYPTELTITPPSSVYVIQGCSGPQGAAAWTALSNIQGSGATLALRDGVISVTLLGEGTITVTLEGQATGMDCNSATSLSLLHTLTLRVRRISGFVVDQLHQRWPGCEQSVVIPAGVEAWIPQAHPLDSSGQRFEAANAPKPVAITLRSTGGLSRTAESWELTAEAGHVELSLDTTRSVAGLKSFEVVGPEALTRVDAQLFLRKAAAKGSVTEPLTDGESYLLWYPEQDNLVDLQVNDATTTAGKLCLPIPRAWLTATSSTPGQCGPAGGELYGGGVPVAKISSLGECRLEVTIPDTSHRWATSFTTR
jgi:hypothetical protein